MFWCSFYTVASSFSHIEGGGFHSRGGARKKFYPVLRGAGGGGRRKFFLFCNPRSPILMTSP